MTISKLLVVNSCDLEAELVGYSLSHCAAVELLQSLEETSPSAVILSTGEDSKEALEALKNSEDHKNIPVILIDEGEIVENNADAQLTRSLTLGIRLSRIRELSRKLSKYL